MSVKKFENARWSRDDQVISFRHRAALEMINAGTVLDLGSGDGLLLSLLKEKGIDGTGLDISAEGVAKTRAKGIKASVFDFNDPIPFQNDSFEMVTLLDLLEHLYTPQNLLREAARVSKRFVIVSVPNFNSLPARIQVLCGRVPENNRPKKGHLFWFNYSVLKIMAIETGLRIVSLQVNAPWQNRFVIGTLLKFLAEMWPSLFALSFVVKLEK